MSSGLDNRAGRLFICDPVCAFTYGHNVAAMRNFNRYLSGYFSETTLVGCRFLDSDIAAENAISREFSYYYQDIMPLRGMPIEDAMPLSHKDKLAVATRDLVELIDRHHVSRLDTLCYPSIDFYSLYALAECAPHLIAAGAPTLMVRLIAVMENAGSFVFREQEAVVIALIQRLRDAGLVVKLAAETPRYAEYLAENLDCFVPVAANIDVRAMVPLSNPEVFRVICPGSARYDKGFLELLEIFTTIRRRDPELKIQFQTQIMPDHDMQNQLSYLAKLYALPGVDLLPAQLPPQQLEAMFDESDLVFMPYAADVYEMRGSAVFIEAICVGRPVIAFDGPAFADQIRYFRGGKICQTKQDMVDEVIRYSKTSPYVRSARARQARERFVRDLENSYREWMN